MIDIDIEGFFDNLDHDLLMRDLAGHVSDKRVLRLIGKYLRAGVLEDGRVRRGAKGAPQGGPLSPLLANLYLDRLDWEMESRGLSFVRYADDITVYARSARSAERNYGRLVEWIEKHLKLRINRDKSGIRSPEEGNFLGFTIGPGGEIGMAAKSVERYQGQSARLLGRLQQPAATGTATGLAALRAWLVAVLPALRSAVDAVGPVQLDPAAHPQGVLAALARLARTAQRDGTAGRDGQDPAPCPQWSRRMASGPRAQQRADQRQTAAMGLVHTGRLRGRTAVMSTGSQPPDARKPHVRWCGRGDGRNPVTPTRSTASRDDIGHPRRSTVNTMRGLSG